MTPLFANIYGLVESGTTEVRYVGRTTKTLDHRLKRHFQQARSGTLDYPRKVDAWIKECGFRVEAVTLAVVTTDKASRSEWVMIQRLNEEGARLTNSIGLYSPTPEHREAIRQSNLERFKDPAARRRIGDVFRGVKLSEERVEAMRIARTGKKRTMESRMKQSAAMKGVPKSEEAKANMRLAQQKRAREAREVRESWGS